LKLIKAFIFSFISILYAGNLNILLDKPYIESTSSHIYSKFNRFSDTSGMECNGLTSPTICDFDTKYDAHSGLTITILIIAMLLIMGFIGRNADIDDYLDINEKHKINSKPMYWGKAILVFVIASYIIKYIHSNDVDKIFNLNKKVLIIQNRDFKEVANYPFKEINGIEILKYTDKNYIHYELNLRLKNKRLNLYASSDEFLCNAYASDLHDKIHIPIFKIKTDR